MTARIIFAILLHVAVLESAGKDQSSTEAGSGSSGTGKTAETNTPVASKASSTSTNEAKGAASGANGIVTTADTNDTGASKASSTGTTEDKGDASGANEIGTTADTNDPGASKASLTGATEDKGDASGANATVEIVHKSGSGTDSRASKDPSKSSKFDQSCDSRKLLISPKWISTESWKDKESTLAGAFAVEMMWLAPDCISDIGGDYRDIITAKNFAGGTSGRVKSAVVSYLDLRRGSLTFVGPWHQSADGSCYPFDTVRMIFDFTIPVPFSKMFRPRLFCNADDASMCTAFENGAPVEVEQEGSKVIQQNTEDTYTQGFWLSAMSCEVVAVATGFGASHHDIVCKMTAVRDNPKRLALEVVPGLIMLIIGYGSFLIPPNLAMPRVATCMIALLTFVGKGTAVLSGTPSSGLSLVEFFYLFGMGAMLANMIGHIFAFRYPHRSSFIDTLSLQVSGCSTMLVLVVFLKTRNCQGIDRITLVVAVVISVVLLVASFVLAVWRFQHVLKARFNTLSAKLKLERHMEEELHQLEEIEEKDQEAQKQQNVGRTLQQRAHHEESDTCDI